MAGSVLSNFTVTAAEQGVVSPLAAGIMFVLLWGGVIGSSLGDE